MYTIHHTVKDFKIFYKILYSAFQLVLDRNKIQHVLQKTNKNKTPKEKIDGALLVSLETTGALERVCNTNTLDKQKQNKTITTTTKAKVCSSIRPPTDNPR